MKNVQQKTVEKPAENKPIEAPAPVRRNIWKWVFISVAAALCLSMAVMSLDAGNSGDEDGFQVPQAKLYYEYYASGCDSLTIIKGSNLEYYPMSFDIVAMALQHVFNPSETAQFRHVCNALMGWLALLFAGLLAMRVAGWRAGIIVMLLMFFSPRFLGHSFNNPKDVPFAALMMMGLYYLVWFVQQLPKVKTYTAVMLAVSVGLATSSRIAGLLLIAYWGMFVVLYFLIYQPRAQYWSLQSRKNYGAIIKQALLMLVIAYVIALALSPWAYAEPLVAFKKAFFVASAFPTIIRQVFDGQYIWSDFFPWYYAMKFMLITIPIAVIIGVAAYLFAGGLKKKNRYITFIIYFAFLFPMFWLIYTKANLYGGWRHSTFIYPPMAVAAGLGFNALINAAKKRYAKVALTALPLVLLLPTIIFTMRNHPYEYTYFNAFVGGIKGAFGNYEIDYYYHSTREMSEWILKDVALHGAPDSTRKTRVVTWHGPSVSYFFRNDTAKFNVGFTRWNERGFSDWDYAVFSITGIYPELLRNKKAFPPKNTVYEVKVDGVPIGIVLKREDRSDFYGHKAMREGKIDTALMYLRKALAYDPENEQALDDIISIYEQTGHADSALMLAKRWYNFNKGNASAMSHLANLYFGSGDLNNAMIIANAITKSNPRDISGLWIAANIYARENNPNAAVRCIDKLLRIRGNFKPAYQLLAQIYAAAGNKQRAQQIIEQMNSIR